MPKGVYKHIHKPWNKGLKVRLNPKGEFKKGFAPWNKGIKNPEMIGNQWAKGNTPNKTSFKKGQRASQPTEFKKGMEGKKREEHPGWKGGLTRCQKLEKLAGRPKPNACEICGGGGQICFDHDHQTGAFRGWLCSRCNLALGNVKDNADLLIALAQYIRNV